MSSLVSAILDSIRLHITPAKCSDFMSAVREEGGDVKEFRKLVNDAVRASDDAEEIESYLRVLFESYCYGAKESFDDFMVAMEWDREPKAKFWLPRRAVLEGKHHIASTIQEFIMDDDAEYLGFSMPPGCGKSTLIKFLLCYIYGLFPRSSNMYVSYSDAVVKMMYDSVSEMLTDDYEYRFRQIFPEVPLPRMSAEYYTITARNKGDFPTIGMISLGGSVTGRTRANKLLITDDLVKNKEVARSPMRLETLYDDYKSTLTTRTIGDNVKQIQLGTIWSVHDPISRMKAEHEGDSRYRFIAIPVEDENGESNFEYDHPDRYNKERIAELKRSLDPVDFSCLYMQQGMEKEGLAFPSEQLLYYNGVLPEGDPDDVEAWCDVAFGGGDSLCMPIAYIYGESVYIHDVIFDRGDKKVTEPRVCDAIIRNQVKLCGFEANAGGEFYAREISDLLSANNYRLNIQSKRAGSNLSKEKRIEQYVPTIKEWYFLDTKSRSKEYQKFMEELCSFSFTQKNLHDDAPDGLAGLCEKMYKKVGKIEVVTRRF